MHALSWEFAEISNEALLKKCCENTNVYCYGDWSNERGRVVELNCREIHLVNDPAASSFFSWNFTSTMRQIAAGTK